MTINRNNIITEFRNEDDELEVPTIKVAKSNEDALQGASGLEHSNAFTDMPDGLQSLPDPSQVAPEPEVPTEGGEGADFLSAITDGGIPTGVELPTPESVEGNIGEVYGINGGLTTTQVEGQFKRQEDALRQATGQNIIAETDDAVTYANYLPTLYDGPTANDLATNAVKARNAQTGMFNAGPTVDTSTSDILKNLKPQPQNRTDPQQFRPESTKNPWDRFLGWVGEQIAPKKEADIMKGDFGVYGKGFIGGALYTLGTPFNAAVGALKDLSNVRNKLISKLPKGVQNIMNFNPITELDRWVNRDVPGHKPLSLFNDNGKEKNESSFLNALRAKRADTFSDYQDSGVVGIRKRELGLKWYQDPTFWAGTAVDILVDPGDLLVGAAMKGLKRLTPPATARTSMANALSEATKAVPQTRDAARQALKESTTPLKAPVKQPFPSFKGLNGPTDVENLASKQLLENMQKAGLVPPSMPVVMPRGARMEAANEALAGVKPQKVKPDANKPASTGNKRDAATASNRPTKVAPEQPATKQPKPTAEPKPQIPIRAFTGEMSLDEFADKLSKPQPGDLVDVAALTKNRRSLDEVTELARKVPMPDGSPVLSGKARFTSWGQVRDRVNALGDDTYRRIFAPYGPKLDLDSLVADSFEVVLPDGKVAAYVEKAYEVAEDVVPELSVSTKFSRIPLTEAAGVTPRAAGKPNVVRYKNPFRAAREQAQEGIKKVRQGLVTEGTKLYDEAVYFLGDPDPNEYAVLKALDDEVLTLEQKVNDPLLVDRYIELQNSYSNISDEVNDLSLQLRAANESKDRLTKEVLERTPDLGKQYPNMAQVQPSIMDDGIKTSKQVPTYAPQPPKPTEQVNVYQGTRVDTGDAADFYSKRNPIDGGTRAELGPAHYFTDDAAEAARYALADPNRDLPNLVGRNYGNGRVNSVAIDAANLIDFNSKPEPWVRELFKDVAMELYRQSGTKDMAALQVLKAYRTEAMKATTHKALYAAYDNALAKVYGIDIPSEPLGNFYRQVNQTLLDSDVIGFKGKNPSGSNTYAILNGDKAKATLFDSVTASTGLESPLEIAGHRYNADTTTALNSPESLAAQVSMKESAVSLQDSIIQSLEEKLDDVLEQQDNALTELMSQYDEMASASTRERATRLSDMSSNIDRQIDDLMRHLDNQTDSACLY